MWYWDKDLTIAASAASWTEWIDFIVLKIWSHSFDAFSDPPWISVKLHGNVNGSIAGVVCWVMTPLCSLENFWIPSWIIEYSFPVKKRVKYKLEKTHSAVKFEREILRSLCSLRMILFLTNLLKFWATDDMGCHL